MIPLKLLKINSTGPLVESWQLFLIGKRLFFGVAGGNFDAETKIATIGFQKAHGLQPDGIVGNKTFGVAMQLGFEGIVDERMDVSGANFPSPPLFPSIGNNSGRQKVFGKFSFIHKPLPRNKENIEITDDWERKNIITVIIPQLTDVIGNDSIQFHRLGANQMLKLWSDWETAGLLTRVLTWGGSFVPRFIRGSVTSLSPHAFGAAFDINVDWNALGELPALVGQKGCVRELVQIANENGFYWGGHFKNRKDGMHFEIAKLL